MGHALSMCLVCTKISRAKSHRTLAEGEDEERDHKEPNQLRSIEPLVRSICSDAGTHRLRHSDADALVTSDARLPDEIF